MTNEIFYQFIMPTNAMHLLMFEKTEAITIKIK